MDAVDHALFARDRCWISNGRRYCTSRWNDWGRWVFAGAAFFLFFVFLLCICCVARRRRKRGVNPYYGTGWMAPNGGKFGGGNGRGDHQSYPMDNPQSGYYPSNNHGAAAGYYNNSYNPPPAYGANEPQYTGTTSNPNDGYYGNQQQYNSGVQSPPNAYHQDGVYPPPPGAPGGPK